MAILPIQAHIRAESATGQTGQQSKQKNLLSVDQVINAAEADIRALRCWLMADRNTPMLAEVGQRLIEVGQWLKTQRGRQ